MNLYFQKKKGMLYQEAIVVAFSLVLTGLFLYLSVAIATNFTGEIEDVLNPDLKSEFESVYIYTFLNQELNKTSKKTFFLDETRDYRVKDLIWYNNDYSVEELNEYREKYIKETREYLEYYYKNTLKKDFNENSILTIYGYNCDFLNIKDFNKENTAFYIKTRDEIARDLLNERDIVVVFDSSKLKSSLMCGTSASITPKFLAPTIN